MRIIVNADDLGMSEAVNEAIFQGMQRGVITSATMLANGPALKAAAQSLHLFPKVVTSKEGAILKDFVLSCRVAQKKVENAWFRWLTQAASSAGYRKICAPYVRTPRNGVLLKALLEVGFIEARKDDAGSMLELDCDATPPASEIVSIVSRSLELQTAAVSSIQTQQLSPGDVDETRQAAS